LKLGQRLVAKEAQYAFEYMIVDQANLVAVWFSTRLDLHFAFAIFLMAIQSTLLERFPAKRTCNGCHVVVVFISSLY
jgi:hypothetical protein